MIAPEGYREELNCAHDAWFEAIYKAKDYKTLEEIALWKDDKEFGAEAISLIALYRSSWRMIDEHIESLTEETFGVDNFIQSLPTL